MCFKKFVHISTSNDVYMKINKFQIIICNHLITFIYFSDLENNYSIMVLNINQSHICLCASSFMIKLFALSYLLESYL